MQTLENGQNQRKHRFGLIFESLMVKMMFYVVYEGFVGVGHCTLFQLW